MNTKYLLSLLFIAGITSCSTSYRTTQTPDDVYYSPVPKEEVYVSTQTNDDRSVYTPNGYERPSTYPEVSVRRSRKYRRYDNYPYDRNYPNVNNYPYGYNYPYGSYPYGTYPVYVDPKTGKAPKYYKPRKFNLDSYRNPASVSPNTTVDPKTGKARIVIPRSSIPSGSNEGQPSASENNRSRRIYVPSVTTESRTRSSDNSSSRTYEPSRSTSNSNNNNSSNNSSSKSTNTTTAPVRKFDKN